MEKIKNYLLGNIWLVVLIATVLALLWPDLGIWLTPYAAWLMMCLVFFGFVEANWRRVKLHLNDYPRKIILLGLFHLLTPMLVWLFRDWLPAEVFAGLMLVAIMPASLYVADLSENCGGSRPKAMVLSLVTNLLSPLTAVGLYWFLVVDVATVDLKMLFLTMIKLTVVPLIIASIIRKTNIKIWVAQYGPELSLVLYFLLILALVGPVRDNILFNWSKSLFLAGLAILFSLIGLIVGYFVGGDDTERISFSILSGYKNAALAVIVAGVVLGEVAAVTAVIYLVINNLLMLPLRYIYTVSKRGGG